MQLLILQLILYCVDLLTWMGNTKSFEHIIHRRGRLNTFTPTSLKSFFSSVVDSDLFVVLWMSSNGRLSLSCRVSVWMVMEGGGIAASAVSSFSALRFCQGRR